MGGNIMKSVLFAAIFAASTLVPVASLQAREAVTYLFPGPDFLPAFAAFQLAKGKGYFRDADLDVTFRVSKGGADVAIQVAVGNADLGGGIGDTPIVVRPNGLKVKGVALLGGHGLTQLAWRADSGISGLKDIKGKRIGVLSYQDTTYYSLLGVLASAGLTKDDVEIQAVGPGAIVQLMIAGSLDVMSGVPEWIAAVETAGVQLEQIPVETIFPSMAQAIIASDRTIAEKPEMIAGFVEAVLHAIRDIENDPVRAAADYVRLVPQHTGRDAEVEAVLREYATKVYPAQDGVPLGSFEPERLAAAQKFYINHGIVQTAVPVADLYTNEFIK